MSVTIIICTRNRADSLRDTLASIAQCEVPANLSAELLVIDNGSTDHTFTVVEQSCVTNIPLRYIQEQTKGLSHARNRAMAEARGDIFLWTDDDVRVPTNWIEAMCRSIADGDADVVAGGVVFPFEQELMLSREPFRSRRSWFASTEGINAGRPQRMVGANMAFSRRLLENVREFDTALGAGRLGSYEETLFCWQSLEAGYRLVSRLDVAVEHHFDLARLTRKHMLRLAAGMGASEGYVAWHWHQNVRPPSRMTRRRAWWGLLLRRIRRPWIFLSGSVPLWELSRIQSMAHDEQLAQESSRPRRYNRRVSSASVSTV